MVVRHSTAAVAQQRSIRELSPPTTASVCVKNTCPVVKFTGWPSARGGCGGEGPPERPPDAPPDSPSQSTQGYSTATQGVVCSTLKSQAPAHPPPPAPLLPPQTRRNRRSVPHSQKPGCQMKLGAFVQLRPVPMSH